MKIILILLFSIPVICYSQISVSYSIGVFGAELKTTSYSSPFSLSGLKCIAINDGIGKYFISGKGVFLNACSIDANYIKYSISLYPNPATNYAVIKFKNKLQNTEEILISVFDNTGKFLERYTITQRQLLQGYKFSTVNLLNGIYFIQISSNQIDQVLKLLIYR